MKRAVTVVTFLLVLLCIIISSCVFSSKKELGHTLADYEKAVEKDLPEDLCLTIYYLSPGILTHVPLGWESLKNHSETKKIIVESEKLETYVELLRKLNQSILQPTEGESCINARLYYVFETENDKLLEVDLTRISGTVFVNGIEVEDHPIFYELIAPFLTEDAYNTLGIHR